MSRTSAFGNFTLLPVLADAADITAVGTTMADRIEKYANMRFASTAVRDATVTAPEEGMECWITGSDTKYLYDGTGWYITSEPEQAWVPAISGITVGNGVKTGGYNRSNGWIDIEAVFTLGTTSAVTGDLVLTLPISSATQVNPAWFRGHMGGVTGESPGLMVQTVVTGVFMRAILASGTYAAQAVVTNVIPFAWATGDKILFYGHYPMTTKYS